MIDPRVSPGEAWRLSALATTISRALRERNGTRKYYSAKEVEEACDECHAPHNTRQYAVAMFVEPAQTQGFLQRLGSSKTAQELRKFLAYQIFFYNLPDASFDTDSIDFHQEGEASGATSGTFGGGEADGGGDGGGSDGDGGGE